MSLSIYGWVIFPDHSGIFNIFSQIKPEGGLRLFIRNSYMNFVFRFDRHRKKTTWRRLGIIGVIIFFIYGNGAYCGSTDNTGPGFEDRVIRETGDQIQWQLPGGETTWLSKRPKRVVILLTSLLNLWYESGGKAIARCSGELHVPQEAKDLPTVGTFAAPNIETIIALEPDLVLASNLPSFKVLMPILDENHIEYAYFDYINFHDYQRILSLFAALNDNSAKVSQILSGIADEINVVRARYVREPAPKVLLVFTTPNSVSCELNGSQTSVMLSMLSAQNVIPDRFSTMGKTRISFSLERIVVLDPDIILLNTMGDVEDCEKRLKKEFSSNQAWAGLRAIQENRFYVLPKEYFLYKPNKAFPKALEYLARVLYGAS